MRGIIINLFMHYSIHNYIQGVSSLRSLTPLSLCCIILLCMYRRRPLPTYFAHARARAHNNTCFLIM